MEGTYLNRLPNHILWQIYQDLPKDQQLGFYQCLDIAKKQDLLTYLGKQLAKQLPSAIEFQQTGNHDPMLALTIIHHPEWLALCTPATLQRWGNLHAEVAAMLIHMQYPCNNSTLFSWGMAHAEIASLIQKTQPANPLMTFTPTQSQQTNIKNKPC